MSWHTRSKSIVRILGLLLSVLCCWYVGRELWSSESPLREGISSQLLGPLIASTACWVLVNTALGVGWSAINRIFGSKVGLMVSVYVSFRTQIAKYLPGNVFHVMGRVVVARQHGVNASMAGLATVIEAFVLIVFASLLGISFLFRQGYLIPALLAFGLGIGVVGLVLGSSFLRANLGLTQPLRPSGPTDFLVGASSYLSVFLLQALMFAIFVTVPAQPIGLSFGRILEMVSVTWVAGFVVIGAPGGLGVREAAYSLFATSADVKLNLLYIASWLRVSSILGDLICFGLSGLILKALSRK